MIFGFYIHSTFFTDSQRRSHHLRRGQEVRWSAIATEEPLLFESRVQINQKVAMVMILVLSNIVMARVILGSIVFNRILWVEQIMARECPVWVLRLSCRKVPNCQAGQMRYKEVSIFFIHVLHFSTIPCSNCSNSIQQICV